MRIFTSLFLALSTFALGACAHPMSHELFPWQLSCEDTPDGFVGVIWHDEGDMTMPLGGGEDAIAFIGICNRTHHPLRMVNVAFGQTPISGAVMTADHTPIAELRGFVSGAGDDLSFSPTIFFGGEWLNFVEDLMDVVDELRRYNVVGHASDATGEIEFRIGNEDGTFADEYTFSTDAGPVPLDHIWHNQAYIRHITVTP